MQLHARQARRFEQPQCERHFQRTREAQRLSKRARVSLRAAGGEAPFTAAALETSRALANLRAARDGDSFAAALVGMEPHFQSWSELDKPSQADVIASRFVDAQLLRCVNTVTYERASSTARETNQVVLVGDGFDTRPYRLPWPEGTVIYVVAPAEVHTEAERQLAGQAARVPRGCLLRRVPANLASDSSEALEAALQAAGLRGDRLSVWAWQLAGCAGLSAAPQLASLLTAVSNMAALESRLVGELPCSLDPANYLAGYGLLGVAVGEEDAAAAVVMLEQELAAAAAGSAKSSSSSSSSEAGDGTKAAVADVGGGDDAGAAALAAAGSSSSREITDSSSTAARPWLFVAQQKRLSLAEMDLWELHGAAQAEAEESDTILPFS